MHLFPCPSCQDPITISPKHAGNDISCPHCEASVTLPKLGDIRSLPLAGDTAEAEQATAMAENVSGNFLGTALLGLLCMAALLAAGFCGIRWYLIEVEMTTQAHIEEVNTLYAEADAARLIREYQDMELSLIHI